MIVFINHLLHVCIVLINDKQGRLKGGVTSFIFIVISYSTPHSLLPSLTWSTPAVCTGRWCSPPAGSSAGRRLHGGPAPPRDGTTDSETDCHWRCRWRSRGTATEGWLPGWREGAKKVFISTKIKADLSIFLCCCSYWEASVLNRGWFHRPVP